MTDARRVALPDVVVADERTLPRLSVGPDFRAFYDGDGFAIASMINGVLSADGRVALALEDDVIVGFCCLLPPLAGDRFAAVPAALEVAALEVDATHRGTGLSRRLIVTALGEGVESAIAFAVVDPSFRDPHESPRRFRDRLRIVFGALGFFPYPTDYAGVRVHRDAAFFVRVGARVDGWQVHAFLEALRAGPVPIRVGVVLRDQALRNLVRDDLRHHGFDVVAVAARPGPLEPVEAVVTDDDAPRGTVFTVRVVDDEQRSQSGSVIRLPGTSLDTLPGVLRHEIERRRHTRWPRSSSNAS